MQEFPFSAELPEFEKMLRTSEILIKYVGGTLTEAELVELKQWLDSDPGNMTWFKGIHEAEGIERILHCDGFVPRDSKERFKQLLERIRKGGGELN